MIKFFRKIRKRLLTENKFSKYLIYAIGEIILVVIGILIALQVNNWNIERKSELKVNELSNNLLQELRGLKRLMDNQLQAVEYQQNLIQYVTNNNKIQMDTVFRLSKFDSFQVDPLNFAFSYIVYLNPRGDLYNSAINEGTLALLESEDIVSNLNTAYTMSEKRWAEHVDAENLINTRIQTYISNAYKDIFNAAEFVDQKGAWDKTTTHKVLQNIHADGELKYLLSAKLQILRFKYASLKKRNYRKVEELIDYFESKQK
ncbi:DUF6090 family protein [Seonamhaeicola maritimus]|uniref:Uncharacterized protein n=1 Tax=Seonamhaeicola maritimus TaxID=2591822 RepID=A0A5C7GET5_9FLAO|nr:DUF6090 family protein [Seonamhaeicola maritimus]TXG35198.1 hypothetical protein FUA22_15715 [Seonamhaeicola maritimus]